ncbi:MAG TPA: endonuclease/exonuclease/phosphatase family protein [Candidatus Saccharimonadales bacterium]|nr:endonuclease/exonuclease/phosphatase family protein [Candidatus Saccharimonadales bacterium]
MPPSVKHPPLSLITLNIRGFQLSGTPLKRRIELILTQLIPSDAAELHLQEVYTYHTLRHLRKDLRDQYPYISYKKGAFGPKAGLVSFFKHTPKSTAFSTLPASHLARLDFLKLIPYIHKGILITTTNTQEIRLNLHLDPDHTGEWNEDSSAMRLITKQLHAVADLIQNLKMRHTMILIAGDFNLPADTATYRHFIKCLALKDALTGNFRPTFHASFLPKNKIPRQIDHVLISSQEYRMTATLILDKPINGMYPSDHLGIKVTIIKQ